MVTAEVPPTHLSLVREPLRLGEVQEGGEVSVVTISMVTEGGLGEGVAKGHGHAQGGGQEGGGGGGRGGGEGGTEVRVVGGCDTSSVAPRGGRRHLIGWFVLVGEGGGGTRLD